MKRSLRKISSRQSSSKSTTEGLATSLDFSIFFGFGEVVFIDFVPRPFGYRESGCFCCSGLRFTFSPRANLMKRFGGFSYFISSGEKPQRKFYDGTLSANRIGRTVENLCTGHASRKLTINIDVGPELITSPILTSALLAWVPSLMPRLLAMWVCSSTMPGVICLPVASNFSSSVRA